MKTIKIIFLVLILIIAGCLPPSLLIDSMQSEPLKGYVEFYTVGNSGIKFLVYSIVDNKESLISEVPHCWKPVSLVLTRPTGTYTFVIKYLPLGADREKVVLKTLSVLQVIIVQGMVSPVEIRILTDASMNKNPFGRIITFYTLNSYSYAPCTIDDWRGKNTWNEYWKTIK